MCASESTPQIDGDSVGLFWLLIFLLFLGFPNYRVKPLRITFNVGGLVKDFAQKSQKSTLLGNRSEGIYPRDKYPGRLRLG